MKRRNFIKSGALFSAPFFFGGFPMFAKDQLDDDLLQDLAKSTMNCDRVLVIIQMNGGNDALNMVIPIDKYASLTAARSNILMPQSAVLTLNNTATNNNINTTTGLHPAMTAMQTMFNNGKINIVQGVSYPNPNFSHFRATDIWFSASDSNVVYDTGWLGRTLDMSYTGYPTGYPSASMPDPLAIQIGSLLPFSLQGANVNMGYNVPNPSSLLNVVNNTTDPAPNNDYGTELTFLRMMKDQSNAYKAGITAAYAAQPTLSTRYPATGNSLANQLKIVARLIGGGLKTPLYIVNQGGSYDLHTNQVDTVNKTIGAHANLLGALSEAIDAFQNDLELMGKDNKVTGMTFSEFGRRIISNASTGTDHGSAAPVIFFGSRVEPGMVGTSPALPANPTVSDQVPIQHDFRSIYTTLIQDWFCMSPTQAGSLLPSNNTAVFNKLPIFQNSVLPSESFNLIGQYAYGAAQISFTVQPNNQYDFYEIDFSTDGKQFETIGIIQNQTEKELMQYQFRHESRAPKMFFRIKGTMKSGAQKFSNTLILRSNPKDQLVSVYPNPVVDYKVNIQFHEHVDGPVEVSIFDMMGAKHYSDKKVISTRQWQIQLPEAFNKATHYVLHIQWGNETVSEQIIFE